MSLEKKIREEYPEEDFRIGDTLIMITEELSTYLIKDFYSIKSFEYNRNNDVIILTNESTGAIHPIHFKNLSALRRKKMKNII